MNAVKERSLPRARLAIADDLARAGHVELEKRVHHVAVNADLERIDDVVPLPRERLHLERGSAHAREDATRRDEPRRERSACVSANGLDHAQGRRSASLPGTFTIAQIVVVGFEGTHYCFVGASGGPRSPNSSRTRSSVSILGGLARCASKPASLAVATSSGCA